MVGERTIASPIGEAKMFRPTTRGIALLFCLAAVCSSLLAQSEKTITVRMLDGKTGRLVEASGFQVRIDHEQALHANWVVQNEDGTGKLIVPRGASLLSIRGTYDNSMQVYVNCDSATEKTNPVDRWYAISEILNSGVVAPNGCGKPGDAAKLKPVAKPGEFVFLVRRMNSGEQWR
jgi:hypothetical protein